MKLLLRKGKDCLIPADEESIEAYQKMDPEVIVEYKKSRNVQFHKKYWALLNAVMPNQSHFKSVQNLHEAIKYRAGLYETVFTLKGEKLIVTKSIAFSKMDEIEYTAFFSHAVDAALELTDEKAVEDILRFI